MKRVGKTYNTGARTKRSSRAVVGFRKLFGGGGTRKIAHQSAVDDMLEILEKFADSKPVPLVLDEVQALEVIVDSGNKCLLAKNLEHIHNGEFSNPVVLACGGLDISS